MAIKERPPKRSRHSVAEARQGLASLVHEAEAGTVVEVTRRGLPVAVMLSSEAYARLEGSRPSFWQALRGFRESAELEAAGIDDGVFEGLRDPTTGRPVVF